MKSSYFVDEYRGDVSYVLNTMLIKAQVEGLRFFCNVCSSFRTTLPVYKLHHNVLRVVAEVFTEQVHTAYMIGVGENADF